MRGGDSRANKFSQWRPSRQLRGEPVTKAGVRALNRDPNSLAVSKVWRGLALTVTARARPRYMKPTFAGGEREELLRFKTRRCRVANPAEVLRCGNAGIREDLGASPRSTGLP